MACSLSSLCTLNQAFCSRHKLFQYPKIRSQSFSDNGKQANNIVDANLSILKGRIEEVRKRERVIARGWNYKHSYDRKYKKDSMISESAEIIGLACGAIGLVFLLGSLTIYLLSLLLYLCI